jgi:glutathionyl-hydroquinone reductase
VSHACPWAHRTVIFRKLKELEGVISLSVVSHHIRSEAAAGGTGIVPLIAPDAVD